MLITGLARLGSDPKMSYTPKGTAQTFFNVAFSTGFGDHKDTVWVGVGAWGKMAETANQYLKKGSAIVVVLEGTRLRTYEKNDGTTMPALDAKLVSFEFTEKSSGQSQQEETPFDGEMPEDF